MLCAGGCGYDTGINNGAMTWIIAIAVTYGNQNIGSAYQLFQDPMLQILDQILNACLGQEFIMIGKQLRELEILFIFIYFYFGITKSNSQSSDYSINPGIEYELAEFSLANDST